MTVFEFLLNLIIISILLEICIINMVIRWQYAVSV